MALKILNDRFVLADEPPRRGGHAEVFRARDMNSERDVAVKLFTGGPYPSPYVEEAYARELKALHDLRHPHVVEVVDFGRDAETQRRFIVLEWMPRDLLGYLTDKRVEGWDDFYAHIARPILLALNFAFEHDVCHRDLKPQNVLMSSDGVPKVADFGLAKFKQYHQPGVTVRDHVSIPYAPPQDDPRRFNDARDVYAFGVLVVRCLTGRDLQTYEDTQAALDDLDVPESVFEVIAALVSTDPSDSPQNVAVLLDDLDAIQSERERHWVRETICHLIVIPKVLAGLASDFPRLGALQIHGHVIDDLNETCGLTFWPSPHEGADKSAPAIALLSSEYRYKAVIDRDSGDHLVIVGAYRSNPSALEHLRESAWEPRIRFKAGRPSAGVDGKAVTSWLLAGIDEHGAALRAEEARLAQERLIHVASNLLNARQALQTELERPIAYTEAQLQGRRLHLTVEAPPEDDLLGQLRLIRRADGTAVAGEVDAVSDNSVVLFLERPVEGSIPRRGMLLFDTRANRAALARQRGALDAVRFNRCVRPDLKRLLLDPAVSVVPVERPELIFFHDDLDEHKRRAVRMALATPDFLLVEGPPGTGKTRFITELVLQLLSADEGCRVLLTSQTHVALDNALERIRRISPNLRLVRIGQRGDARVAPAVTDLLLANQADSWLESVRKASETFLTQWATSLGVSRTDINLGIAVGRLRASLEIERETERTQNESETEVSRLTAEIEKLEATSRGDTYFDLREALDQANERLAELRDQARVCRQQIRAARSAVASLPEYGRDLSRLPPDELREWEEGLLGSDPNSRQCKRVIELVEEWHLRFGRSTDFHGALLADASVVSGTCVGFGSARGINQVDFDVCIIDEASKATINELLVPLSRARKWILVGDSKQLPPFVEEALRSREILERYDLRREELEISLLDHLSSGLPPECTVRLLEQHRMIRPIGDLISACFYDGTLESSRDGRDEILPLLVDGGRPVTWLTTARLESRHEIRAGASFVNLGEVRQIVTLLKRLAFSSKARSRSFSVAVIAGYSAQRAAIRRALEDHATEFVGLGIECNTVDAFQGREADIAIYSVTRSNPDARFGFLREPRRLNVALSRGRAALIVVGDHVFARQVEGQNPFRPVLDYIELHPDDCALVEARE